MVNFTFDMKKKVIIDFFKNNGNTGFSQGELVKHLKNDLLYANDISARVSISKILNYLEEDGVVRYVEKKPTRGSIKMKVWYLKDGI